MNGVTIYRRIDRCAGFTANITITLITKMRSYCAFWLSLPWLPFIRQLLKPTDGTFLVAVTLGSKLQLAAIYTATDAMWSPKAVLSP
jgi:hypothetical protein